MDRVRYNPENFGEKTIKTAMREVFQQFNEAILKAEELGNVKLGKALRKQKEKLYAFDYKTLEIICDLQP